MSDAETIIKILDNRKRASRWRLVSIILFVALAFVIGKNSTNKESVPYIAKYKITDQISYNSFYFDHMYSIKNDKNIKALIIEINSPGGSAAASEELYRDIKSLSEHKPVLCMMKDIATSGAYMISLACNHVVALNTTITGSIGVITEYQDMSSLAEKFGIKYKFIRSGKLKGKPHPMEKIDLETEKYISAVNLEVFRFFCNILQERRKISDAAMKELEDGRILLGNRAVNMGLIDAIGGQSELMEWLKTNKKITDIQIKEFAGEGYDSKNSIFDKLFRRFNI